MTDDADHRDVSPCDQELIREFLTGGQYEIEEGPFAAHLEDCPACRAELEATAGTADDWQEAAKLLRSTEFDAAGYPDFSAATFVESTAGFLLPPSLSSTP